MRTMGWKNKIQEYIRENKLRKRWHKVTVMLAMAAVVVTGAVMILPAITMENGPQMLECQIDIHTHTDSCYDEGNNLICGYADFVVHSHDSSCYAEDGTLICPLNEIETHTHDASCYQEELICGKEEIILHTHTDACLDENGNLICGMLEVKEHIHDESCIPQIESSEPAEEPTVQNQSGSSWAIVSKPGYIPPAENAAQTDFGVMTFAALQTEASGYDFAEDITDVTVERQQGGQWTQSDTFTDGDTIRVTIRYTIPQGMINETQRSMYYQLPAGIALEKNETGDVYLESGQKAGTYVISADGLISITFDATFANGDAFSGNLHFQGSIALADLGEGEEIQFGGDGGTITVVPEEKQYSLNIGKLGAYVRNEEEVWYYEGLEMGIDIQPGHLLYTLEVWANERSDGSDGPITVTDHFTHWPGDGVITYDKNNIKVFRRTPTIEGGYSTVEVTEYTLEYTHEQTGTNDTQTSSFTISGLPALGPNEVYVINYSALPHLDTVHSNNGQIAAPNTAAARDNSKTVSADATVVISRRMVQKEVRTNEGTGNVQWTVTLNEDGRNLSGMEFRDEMTYTLNGETALYNLENMENLRVTAYSVNAAGQQTLQGDVTDAFEALIAFENGVMTIHFPAEGAWPEGLSSNWIYEIVYETPFPGGAEIEDPIAFANTAQLGEYSVTANWNGTVPDMGYGLVKENVNTNLNTETEVGTIDWRSTISYPSANFALENLRYMDWIPDAYYNNGSQFVAGSHYTTLETLRDTLYIENALGEALNWGEDFTVSVVYAKDMPDYSTFSEAWNEINTIYALNFTDVTNDAASDEPIALFCITFTDASGGKLGAGQRLYISYRTLVDRQNVTNGEQVTIRNVGHIPGYTDAPYLYTAFHQQLTKQVSNTGMPPGGDDFDLNSDVYVDGPVNLDLGDTGGKLYYRILFYNYGDTIKFHDDLLQKFDGKITFNSTLYVYNAAIGIPYTVKTWDYLDSSGKYRGDYTLNNLGQFRDCIIGLYYSIDVSGDEELAGLGEGETYTYTNTVEWTGVDTDSTTAHVTNSEQTLQKESALQSLETGENLVYYYVKVNPESRDLHPTEDVLELRDTLSLPAGATATLRPETIGLYHYDAQNEAGYYLGAEVTAEEFDRFRVEQTEGTANSYTFTVPDEMACVVVYAYEINQGTSALEELQINNTASLLGRAVISAGDNITIRAQESGAQVNRATLTIYKIGGNDISNLLQGVLFDLFRYEQQDDGTYSWVRTDLTARGPEAEDGGRHFITGGDELEGAIILNFLDEVEEGNTSYYNTLYRLTEFQSVDGYEKDASPRYYVWGEYNKTEEQTAAEMADALAEANVDWDQVMFIPFGQSMTETINNEPTTTSITATKQWLDMNGEESSAEDLPESITLTLYQHMGETKTVYGDAVTVQADENGDWEYSWENLPRKDENGNYYTYSVEETAIGDGTDMDDYDVSYRYPDDGNGDTGIEQGEVRIVNTKIVRFVLPETGGTGTIFFVIAGLLLVGASGVGYIYTKRKDQRGGDIC